MVRALFETFGLFLLPFALFAVYLVGCAIGSWLRDRVVSRHATAL